MSAQTLFQWPPDTADVASYSTVEECAAAVRRVTIDEARDRATIEDTLPLRAAALAPVPAVVVATAKTCAAKFGQADRVSPTDFWLMLRLAVLARHDAGAEALLQRRLAAFPRSGRPQRAAVLDSALDFFVSLQRTAAADSIASLLWPLRNEIPWTVAARHYQEFGDLQLVVGDTSSALKAMNRVRAIVEAVPAAAWSSSNVWTGTAMLSHALDVITARAALDSLQRGSKAYVSLRRANLERAQATAPPALRSLLLPLKWFPIGQHAPPLRGDFWFNRGDSTRARPELHRVNLLVFEFGRPNTNSASAWAELRRLGERFPDLALTIVTSTSGHFSKMDPPSASEEAAQLRNDWLGFWHVPATLVVTKSTFYRLPEPDRRVIVQRPLPNFGAYRFGNPFGNQPLVIVDQDGTVIEAGGLGIVRTPVERAQLDGWYTSLLRVLAHRSS